MIQVEKPVCHLDEKLTKYKETDNFASTNSGFILKSLSRSELSRAKALVHTLLSTTVIASHEKNHISG